MFVINIKPNQLGNVPGKIYCSICSPTNDVFGLYKDTACKLFLASSSTHATARINNL